MELFLKITATLLLLALPLHLVHVEEVPGTTESPRRTINKDWYRELPNKQTVATDWSSSGDQPTDESGQESGIASGFMVIDEDTNNTLELTTQPIPGETTFLPENEEENNTTTFSNVNLTGEEENVTDSQENPQNSTLNATDVTDATDATDATTPPPTTPPPTTLAPETISTTAGSESGSDDKTESTMTTAIPGVVQESTTREEGTVSQEPTTAAAPGTSPPLESSTTVLEATTFASITPDRANLSDKGAAAESGTEDRGFISETERQRRKGAWGAVLGTFVAVAVVGLVAYVILKKKHHKAFSHRKLEEDFPSDPVLRLDNSEPLDLNFGRAAYYNPGLQGDNIQMSPFPKH